MTLEDFLSPSVPTLQEHLKENGFTTVAISAMGNIAPYFGFGKAFDLFVELYKEESVIRRRHKVRKRSVGWENHFKVETEEVPIPTSEDINQFLFPFLKQHRQDDLFFLIWSIDTHDPFFHRDPTVTRFAPPSNEISWPKDVELTDPGGLHRLKTLYEDMIYYNDYQIGNLVAMLNELEMYDETLMIVTGDHGESFGEHGIKSHANFPFDEQIKIPLILKFPKAQYKGRIADLVQHIDVTPTVLDYLKMGRQHTVMQGKSLLPLITDGVPVNGAIFAETQVSRSVPGYLALRTEGYKYIEMKPEKFVFQRSVTTMIATVCRRMRKYRWLYSIREDPAENANVFSQKREIAEQFQSLMRGMRRENEKVRKTRSVRRKNELEDADVAKQLKGLGYLE
jgi:arylsulfatase A-like enzyme